MRPTPETDAAEAHAKYWPNEVDWPNKCRKMERARDEARKEARGYKAAYDSAAEMCRVLKARLERYEDAAENADVCVPPPAADSLALADAGGENHGQDARATGPCN